VFRPSSPRTRFGFAVKQCPGVADFLAIEVEQPEVGRAVVVFKGEHDLGQAVALRERLSALVAENELVVADFSRARFVDAAVLNVLLDTRREAENREHRFRIQMGTECVVYRVFDLAGVLSVLECASSREEALGESSRSDA
jgi:anti-anti-sigma factor